MVELASGTLIGAQLRLVAPLGRGGMGRVWTAAHLGLGATVAVKFVAPERLEQDPALRERLRREARVAAQLSSPHATRVYDIGETSDGTPFIVMERLSGETLAARLARTERMALRDVAAMISQIAGVLAAAHALGVVHRDIKPENLFLVDNDYGVFVKVLDFGVAKDLRAEDATSLTSTGAMIGTPQYMAPEQLLGSSTLDERCDVWSLGIVAYHALVGRRPFDGATVAALSIAICGGAFTPPSEMDAQLPGALDAWFARSLSVPVELRFGSIREQTDAFIQAVGASVDSIAIDRESLETDTQSRDPGESTFQTTKGDKTESDRTISPSTFGGTASRATIGGRPRAAIVGAMIAVAAAGIAISLVAHRGASDVKALGAANPSTPTTALERPVPAPSAPIDSPPISTVVSPSTPSPLNGVTSPAISAGATSTKRPSALGASPTASPSAGHSRPPYCETDEGFAVDGQGHLRPRPECL